MPDFAPGIPTKKDIHPLPEISSPTPWNMSIQLHKTKKGKYNREHFDLRLNPPGSWKAYSWAIPNASLPGPGQRTLAVETFTHRADYMPFTGTIGSGYGKGEVINKLLDKVEVLRANPDKIVFNLYNEKSPQEYALIRVNNDAWVLINRTVTKDTKKLTHVLDRPKYKEKSPEQLKQDKEFKDHLAMPKIDGAHGTVHITPKEVRVFSIRPPKDNKLGVIEWTHKMPDLMKIKPHKELANTILRAEVTALNPKTKKAIKPELVPSLLNTKPWESREKQKIHGKLHPFIFDIVKYKNKNVTNTPYSEKRKMIKEVIKKIPQFKEIPVAEKDKDKLKMLNDIKKGKIKLTKEGIVLVDKQGNFTKVKFTNDYDVYLREFYMGEGKYKNVGVGGFKYSLTPEGKILGSCGTGLEDNLRKEMLKNPQKYIGKVAKIKATAFTDPQGNVKSLRAPVFTGWHIEKNL